MSAHNCNRCGKGLSRKTARLLHGEILCSPCMFAPRKSGDTRSAKTEGLGPKDEHAVGDSRCAHPQSPKVSP